MDAIRLDQRDEDEDTVRGKHRRSRYSRDCTVLGGIVPTTERRAVLTTEEQSVVGLSLIEWDKVRELTAPAHPQAGYSHRCIRRDGLPGRGSSLHSLSKERPSPIEYIIDLRGHSPHTRWGAQGSAVG